MKHDVLLDATGLICPMPVLKAKKKLKELLEGQVLKVLATDSNAPKDFVSFCEMTGYTLLESTSDEACHIIYIRKN